MEVWTLLGRNNKNMGDGNNNTVHENAKVEQPLSAVEVEQPSPVVKKTQP